MTPRGIRVSKDTSFEEVVRQLQDKEKFCAVILEGKQVVGIFTERDALKRGLLKDTDPDTPIGNLMTPRPTLINKDESLAVAIHLMNKGQHRHLPVVGAKNEFLGLVSVRDIVFYLSENYPCDVFNLPPDPHKVSSAAEGA